MTRTPPSPSSLVRSSQWDREPLQIGDAISVIILLSDWDKFGLSERVSYHFDLIDTLTASTVDRPEEHARRRNERNESPSDDGVCGVVSLLECIPKTTRYNRRDLRSHILSFNMYAQQVRREATVACFEPSNLPLRLSAATRVSFTYEVTKLAFCLDASPSLVTTFGNALGQPGEACCPLDKLEEMTLVFFKSLVKPITAPWLANPEGWRPIVAVTVFAVYPNAAGASDTSILVRDFRVVDTASAELLSKEISQWALRDVEGEIANRIGHTRTGDIHGWHRPTPSSSLRDVFDASDVALSLLPTHARPCIVLATDCRSVTCENILDLFQDPERVDTPLVVLDLSRSSSHSPQPEIAQQPDDKTTFFANDPGSFLSFPLHSSDDSENLFAICQATAGAFFDIDLLREASISLAGNRAPEQSPISSDAFFAFKKRRGLRPNAVQWYTLFSLSPLSPCFQPSWGKLVPPTYIRERQKLWAGDVEVESRLARASLRSGSTDIAVRSSIDHQGPGALIERTGFYNYVVSPVRVKGLLLMRVKEGYRAKQYGQSTQDPDKVSIQFKLPLEFGPTVLHYELSYRALDDRFPYVGVANIKIELSGERNFIQMVKNDFISNPGPGSVQTSRPPTIAMRASAKLCKMLRGVRREDCLQAYLCPLSWEDKLSTSDSPFARRLGTLSQLQRRRHFRLDQFDVLCVGRVPYEHGEYLILSEFIDFDSGEEELYDSVSDWSTQTIKEKKRYVKKTSSSRDDLVAYCVIEITRSGSTARIFTITVETFGGSCAVDRLAMLLSLKRAISTSKDVIVLPKPMNDYLVGLRDPDMPELKLLRKQRFLESHFHHKSWSGGPTPELLSLLTKRRNEKGGFWFLRSSDTYSLFSKLVTDDGGRLVDADFTKSSDLTSSELYQVQYQIALISGSIVIDMHVEREQGVFFAQSRRQSTRFHELFERVRVHDQECGRALNSRMKLLSLLDSDGPVSDQRTHVERLLKYASRLSRKLRFFHSGAAVANKVLEELTVQLLLSSSSDIQVRRLPLESVASVVDIDDGIWFFIQFDGHTMGFAHLASSERQEGDSETQTSFMFRELTFFSIGISDLYCKRDLIADDDSSDEHISEYMCVSEFADRVEARHGRNYARAAYLALRSGGKSEQVSFDTYDFAYAVGHCMFSEFKGITLEPETESTGGGTTISRIIAEVLGVVPGDKHCLFYSGDEGAAPLDVHTDVGDIDAIDAIDDEDESRSTDDFGEHDFSDDGVDSSHYLVDHHHDTASYHEFSLSSDGSDMPFGMQNALPPVFVRLYLDDELIAPDDIRVSKSATLKAQISLFNVEGCVTHNHFDDVDPRLVPESHYAVVLRIRSLLDSYVAEQLLERIRHHGKSISRADLKLARHCLYKARHVLSHDIKIQFYNAKSDSMVSPAAPTKGDAEVDQAVMIFRSELQSDRSIQMESTSSIGFFVSNTVGGGSALCYWCFVTLKIHLGVVNVKLYHPEGERKATEALSGVLDHISRTTHRVNQMLLLHSLHRSRVASNFLIPGDDAETWRSDQGGALNVGSFGCPVQFKMSFALYERCVASQVVLSLEASVLHSFAVSNRRGVFVYKDEYKDESQAIFYMKLRTVVGDDEGQIASVELLVFGLRQPGPSVTRQLSKLLQRKVHLLAVDALSTVLTKNPHLKWKASDVKFLRSFDKSWQITEDENDIPTFPNDVDYVVPDYVYDPVMLLVYFRQNICGSTFFHRLQQARTEVDGHGDVVGTLVPQIPLRHGAEAAVPFDPSEFALFYNNAPSPLDPDFQPVKTLTSKGAEYSQKTGTGIAIIEVTLIDRDGQTVQSLDVGKLSHGGESVSVPHASLLRLQRIRRGSKADENEKFPQYRLRVSIVDTAIDRETLHNWVELTLNQVLIAWVIERHIQDTGLGLPKRSHALPANVIRRPSLSLFTEDRIEAINKLEPGLPRFFDILDSSHDLPHPAIQKLELGGVIKASAVATVALEMLETCLKGLVGKGFRQSDSGAKIMRSTRTELPSPVNLVWDSQREKALAMSAQPCIVEQVIQDAPIDCPEYLCFCCFSHYGNDDKDDADWDSLSPSAMCFREVMVDDKSDGRKGIPFIDALLAIRKTNPSVFSRSLAFILSIKRNRRMVMVYNWNPSLWKSVASDLMDVNTVQRNIARESVHSLQRRCLQILSPPVTKHGPRRSEGLKKAGAPESSDKKEQDLAAPRGHLAGSASESAQSGKPPSRRIQRPTSIRRPKLIGKSVEGAAMQAMAASRHRARSNTKFGASPLQKTVKTAAPSGGLAPKADTASTVTTVESRDEAKQLDARSNQGKGTSPEQLSLLKAYAARLSLTALSPFYNSKTMQALLDKHWVTKPERPISPSIRDFLLTRSVRLWSSACVPFGFPDRMMQHVSGYFTQWLKMSNPEFELLQLNAPSPPAPSTVSPSSTIMVNLKRVKRRNLYVVLRISLRYKHGMKDSTLRCDAWMLVLARDGEGATPQAKRRKRRGVANQERESTLLDKKIAEFTQSICLEIQFFNFSSFLIESSIHPWKESLSPSEMLSLLQEIMTRYSFERQLIMNGLRYTAFDAAIVLASYENQLINLYDSNRLFDYLTSNATSHDMILCNSNGLCFRNNIDVEETMSTCFLTRDVHNIGKMKLLILTRLEGRSMKEYVFRKGNPIGMQLVDAVAIHAAAAAEQVLQAAAESIRRDMLWTTFSSRPARRVNSIEELRELMQMVSSGPLADVDPRLPPILFDPQNEYGLDWRECCKWMGEDPLFSPPVVFDTDQTDTTQHLFYMELFDEFLLVKVSKDGNLVEARLLWRERKSERDEECSVLAGQAISNYLVHFLWHHDL